MRSMRWRHGASAIVHPNQATPGQRTTRSTETWLPPAVFCTPDAWFPHPVYGRAGWISVVDPSEHTSEEARGLLEAAHDAARRRYQRHLPE
jgi:hypothetical protein